MQWFWLGLGAICGSAANALIDRLPREVSWVSGRSKCDQCQGELKWPDLVPVVSFLLLGGKCRYCHSPIPYRNLVVEVFLAMVFVAVGGSTISVSQLLLAMMITVSTVVAVMDWETKLVSDAMVAVWAGAVVAYQVSLGGLGQPGWASNHLIGMGVGVAVIAGLWWGSRGRAMGAGDIGIAAVLGWWLGWPGIGIGLWLAFVGGAVYGAGLVWKRRAKMKSEIAFGPWLVAGGWGAFWWGDKLWHIISSGMIVR